jgi:hypothetical protein
LQALSLKNENEGLSQEREIPPYNGYGTLEDSLGSVKYLVLKPPKKDFLKMLENEHKVLRFVAVLESKHKEDATRQFVISYRLADDMLTIYEPPQRNAGFLGGKFLERTRALKPGHTLQNPSYYNVEDFYVGGRVEINHHTFILIDADEYVFNYMEENVSKFPQSNFHYIVPKLKSLPLGNLRSADKNKNGYLTRQQFLDALAPTGNISRHELIVLARKYDLHKNNQIHYEQLISDAK